MGLRIGIIGCGTAGQASAILLARQGHDVEVLERTPRVEAVGAGLLLQPTGMAVLGEIGAADELITLASPIRRLLGTIDGGRAILDLRYADLRDDLSGWGLQRSAISGVLLRAMEREGVTLTLGAEVESISERSIILDSRQREHGPYDLIIVADGARSAQRPRMRALVRRDRPYAWGALWFIGEDPDGFYGDTLRQVYRGTGLMIGFLPSGRAESGAPERVSLFWSMRCADWRGAERFDLDAWKRGVRALTDHADPLLAQIHEPSQVIFAPYRDAILRRPFERNIVFVGDAAHAMSPQLGQGVNLALLDARALAGAIEEEASLEAALRRYARERRRNVAFYQRASRWLTPVFQSNIELLAPIRDALLGPVCRFGPTRREMLRSLCGVKTGALTSDHLPPNS